MRENRDFVVPVNILTPLRAPRFLGPHDTLPCVLMHVSIVTHNGNLQTVNISGISSQYLL